VALGLVGSGGSDFDTMNIMNVSKNLSLSKNELAKLIMQRRRVALGLVGSGGRDFDNTLWA
jgi:hypothetical protein